MDRLALSAPLDFETALTLFLAASAGKSPWPATLRANETDLRQFVQYCDETNVAITCPGQVRKSDFYEYLAALAAR